MVDAFQAGLKSEISRGSRSSKSSIFKARRLQPRSRLDLFCAPTSVCPNQPLRDSCIETALELGEQLQDRIVGKRQKLRHDRAGHPLVRIEPEVGVKQTGPGKAPGAPSGRPGFGVDVERQSP